jgi:mono/diheme cytochrome c family protein
MLVCLAFVPPAVIARVRANPSPNRGIAIIQNMADQPSLRAQQPNELFQDGRAARPPIAGALARQDPVQRDVLWQGGADGAWSTALPPELTLDMAMLERGRERYAIYCALCHGYAGFGDGIINVRAQELLANVSGPVDGTVWVQPRSLHEPEVEAQPVGQIFHTISNGIRNMAGYAAQIPVEDRWAIAAYVKALQRSQNAREQDVPADKRPFLKPAS